MTRAHVHADRLNDKCAGLAADEVLVAIGRDFEGP